MTTEIFSTDILTSGISGLVIGGGIGYVGKKIVKVFFKTLMIVGILWIGSLFYLSSIRVINLNEKALDNLVNQSMTTANNLYNTTQSIGIENGLQAIGIPLSSGLAIGFIAGWMKG
jgi:uncharacterized membrane protein (Fun14 family)